MMMMIMTLSRKRNRNINNINSNRNNNNSSTIILIAMITSKIVVESNRYVNNRIYNNIDRSRLSLFLNVTYVTDSFSLTFFFPITNFSRSLVFSFADRRNKILVAHDSAEK